MSSALRNSDYPAPSKIGTSTSTDPGSLLWSTSIERALSELSVKLVESPSAANAESTEQQEEPSGRATTRTISSISPVNIGGTAPNSHTAPGMDLPPGPASLVGPAVALPTAKTWDNSSRSQVIAEWHGQVVAVEDGYLVAELRGTLGNGVAGSFEEAQIPIEEVRTEDLALVRAGAFFRLCVNWEFVNGSRRRLTDLVFRRMPAYRRDELEDARAVAGELWHALRVE